MVRPIGRQSQRLAELPIRTKREYIAESADRAAATKHLIDVSSRQTTQCDAVVLSQAVSETA